MEIRYIDRNDDLLEISDIYEKSWKYAYKNIIPKIYLDSIPRGQWAGGVTKDGMNSLAAVDNDRIVGTCCFCASRQEKLSGFGEIVSLYLLPEYIGKGCGKALLNRCVYELHSKGLGKIFLWVLEDNNRARRFYERNGFVCSNEYLYINIGGKDLKEIMYCLFNE